jgi:hypothetical protein
MNFSAHAKRFTHRRIGARREQPDEVIQVGDCEGKEAVAVREIAMPLLDDGCVRLAEAFSLMKTGEVLKACILPEETCA